MGLEDRGWFQDERDKRSGKRSQGSPRASPGASSAAPSALEPKVEIYDKFRLGRIRGLLARERVISRLDGSVVPPPRSAPKSGSGPELGSGAWLLLTLALLVAVLVTLAIF